MKTTGHRDVVVIGGGISGLVTAWRLQEEGVDVALIERDRTVGGCMKSEARDGCILEKGPFNVLVRDDAFHDLLEACADEVEPVRASDAAKARYVLKGGRLHQVATGPIAFLRSPLLSFPARIRMILGMLLSPRARTDDPSIDDVARRRLGPEVADTMISSIVAGVFGGDSRNLSLKACFPKAWQFDRDCRSPLLYEIKTLRERKKLAEANPERRQRRGLVSFPGGLQALPDWLARRLGDHLVTGSRVESIEPTANGYAVTHLVDGETRTLTCRRLVLATPKDAAAHLLRSVAPAAARILDSIESASLVVLNLGYEQGDIGHPMAGYGFLVPRTEEDVPVMGVLWADSAFPHHAREDRRIVRVFMGGPRDPDAPARTDSELVDIATKAVAPLLEITGDPELIDVCRWPDSIPQYRIGHTEQVDRIHRVMTSVPGLHLVGNYLEGVSINDCVRNATTTASEIARALATAPSEPIPPSEARQAPPTKSSASPAPRGTERVPS